MKRLLFFLFLNSSLVYSSLAQVVLIPDSATKSSFRPKAKAAALLGVNIASLSNYNGADSRIGVMFGVAGEYQFARNLGIAAELNYSRQGTVTTKAEYKLDYLKLPVLLTLHDNDFMVQAGLYGAVLMKGRAGYGAWNENVTKRFADTEIGMSLGLAYNFSGNTLLGARFQRGFDNVNKTIADPHIELTNSTLQIYGGYKF